MSSCGCTPNPCSCVDTTCAGVESPCGEPLPEPCARTLCDGQRANNVWVEGADAEGNGGICLLDTMELDQIIHSLQRDPQAKVDLLTVTHNEYLRNLANTTPLLPQGNEGDTLQKEMNQNTIPFYSIFRGQPPFAQ